MQRPLRDVCHCIRAVKRFDTDQAELKRLCFILHLAMQYMLRLTHTSYINLMVSWVTRRPITDTSSRHGVPTTPKIYSGERIDQLAWKMAILQDHMELISSSQMESAYS
ncbi:uncharacterized protein PHALS_04660 [Plasmopara halstedii]|uniref:Uncharacterized protein n=1 Tax=Plasmopara halstedii TaxID=4781 RepID=A0A0P1AA47_PLAHL|nr:uncharacterized protein PHALS_04660 [Plasmopara halstedii]CEG37215.1 hypothetical protein PHALS_04660 [Plasmopara halstedii]|eukprot:XP_024573584.1 hypothetical protein PHALS_04660 [Plasmopara halstedii]